MKVLVISQFFRPDITAAAFRVSETCEQLIELGFDLRVITTNPHRGAVSVPHKFEASRSLIRVPIVKYRGGGAIDYGIHYLSFLFSGVIFGALRLRLWKPDVVWATSPPIFSGLLGVVMKTMYRSALILDVRDLWPDAAEAAGQLKRSDRLYSLSRLLERAIYRRADTITCVAKPMAREIERRSPGKRVVVIYNGVQEEFLNRKRVKRKVRRHITYAGNLGRVQALEELICAFASMVSTGSNSEFELRLIGQGVLREKLITLKNDLGLHDLVKVEKPINKESLYDRLASSEILYFGLLEHSALDLTIPSKLFDYMAVGRPIVGAVGGQAREILLSCDDNEVATPGDPKTISLALERSILKCCENRLMGCNPTIVAREFTRETAVAVLQSEMQRLIRK